MLIIIQDVTIKVGECSGQNSGSSMDMTSQILTFVRSEFSVIIEITGHFLSSTTRKRDC